MEKIVTAVACPHKIKNPFYTNFLQQSNVIAYITTSNVVNIVDKTFNTIKTLPTDPLKIPKSVSLCENFCVVLFECGTVSIFGEYEDIFEYKTSTVNNCLLQKFIVKVVSGKNHFVCLSSDGIAYAFGSNSKRQCHINLNLKSVSLFEKLNITNYQVKNIFAFDNVTVIIDMRNRLKLYGDVMYLKTAMDKPVSPNIYKNIVGDNRNMFILYEATTFSTSYLEYFGINKFETLENILSVSFYKPNACNVIFILFNDFKINAYRTLPYTDLKYYDRSVEYVKFGDPVVPASIEGNFVGYVDVIACNQYIYIYFENGTCEIWTHQIKRKVYQIQDLYYP